MTLRAWSGRRVLVTGHTGFKGTWLTMWLERLGAHVTGLSLAPQPRDLWNAVAAGSSCHDLRGDVRCRADVATAVERAEPDVILHLAAQSLVTVGFEQPRLTFDTNITGVTTVLDVALEETGVGAVLVVTSDKVYARQAPQPYDEDSQIGGEDPYSASKACAELAVAAYRSSFFSTAGTALVTARAGNVIGGGDRAPDRLLPDLAEAGARGGRVKLRNPEATRPWQHVLDPLHGYLLLVDAVLSGDHPELHTLNFGPPTTGCASVRDVVALAARHWPAIAGWEPTGEPPAGKEATSLLLDSSLATRTLGWHPSLDLEEAVGWTIEWYRRSHDGEDERALTIEHIERYMERLA